MKDVLRRAAPESAYIRKQTVYERDQRHIPLYENVPTFENMVSYVESLGYALFSLVPGFRDERTGRIFQVDGFFIRRAPEL
jgi:hypothetical protein